MAQGITGPVVLEWLPDGVHMRVLYDITYEDHYGREWYVKAGFVTDGASIPRALWAIVGAPYNGLYRIAALFHDAAYADPGIPKEQADLMLRDFALFLGCPHPLAEVIYTGVRFGGADSYTNDQYDAAIALLQRLKEEQANTSPAS